MPDAAWYERMYQSRDGRMMPLEPGHRFFLSDSRAPLAGSLLDVGCGTGNFLLAARDHGFCVAGLELDTAAARFALKCLAGVRIYAESIEAFRRRHPGEKFNIVTFFEVLEHQDRPREFLEAVRTLLHARGWIALSVPNRSRWQTNLDVLDYPPNHLTRWNAAALWKLLRSAGFEILTVCEEPLHPRRAAEMLSGKLRTGFLRKLAGIRPADFRDLAQETIPLGEGSTPADLNGRNDLASWLVRAKISALVPVAAAMLPYFRMRGYKGLYLYCLARRLD